MLLDTGKDRVDGFRLLDIVVCWCCPESFALLFFGPVKGGTRAVFRQTGKCSALMKFPVPLSVTCDWLNNYSLCEDSRFSLTSKHF